MEDNKLAFPDARYTAAREFCGYSTQYYVLRFCGDFILSYETKEAAIEAAIKHNQERTA